jgi:multiple PDZ domain protein
VENGIEVHPHHYIRSILPDGPVGLTGRLQAGDELLQVNDFVLYGRNHIEVVTTLKELPRHVRIVCARSLSLSVNANVVGLNSADLLPHLFKAKSEQVLPLAAAADTNIGGLLGGVVKARSLEPLSGIAMWGGDVVAVELYKGDRGLGFSILDYQVSVLYVFTGCAHFLLYPFQCPFQYAPIMK